MASESAVLWKCGSCDDCFYDINELASHKCVGNNETTTIGGTCMKELEVQTYSSDADIVSANEQVQAIGCLAVLEGGVELDGGIVEGSSISFGASSMVSSSPSKPTIISVRNPLDNRRGKKRQKAKRSIVWTYFTALDDKKAMCCICEKVIAYCGTPTNLVYHLSRFHPAQGNLVKSKQEGGLKYQYLENKLPKANPLGSATTSKVVQTNAAVINKKTSGFDKLIEMFALDLQLVNILEGQGFRKLINALDPTLKLPEPKKMLQEFIPRKYYAEYKKVQNYIQNAEKIHLSVELWCGCNEDYFATITAHFVTKLYERKYYTLKTAHLGSEHNPQTIVTELLCCISNWDITKNVMCVLTDGSDDIKKAAFHTGWKHIVCFAHTLNRIIKESLASSPELVTLLEKCRAVVSFLKHNDVAKQKVRDIQAHNKQMQLCVKHDNEINEKPLIYPLKPKKDVPTQWISVFYMLQRIFTLKNVVTVVLDNVPSTTETLTDEDWIAIEETISLLKAFEVVTLELCSEKFPQLSKVIPVVQGLLSLVNNCNTLTLNSVEKVRKDLLSKLRKRVGQVEHNVTFAMSTVLDPRFKNIAFQSETAVENVIEALSIEGCKQMSDLTGLSVKDVEMSDGCSSYTDSLWEGFDKKATPKKEPVPASELVTIEIKRYLEEPLIDRKKNPLCWWKDVGCSRFPALSVIARQVLSIPATSVPPERVFLMKGQLFADKRKSIKPKYIDQFLFLNMNIE